MKFFALIASASASVVTWADQCWADTDCPMFFNEPMSCAVVTESWDFTNPMAMGTTGTSTYQWCVPQGMCGFSGVEFGSTMTYMCGPVAQNNYAMSAEAMAAMTLGEGNGEMGEMVEDWFGDYEEWADPSEWTVMDKVTISQQNLATAMRRHQRHV